jgi:hypothetical protein
MRGWALFDCKNVVEGLGSALPICKTLCMDGFTGGDIFPLGLSILALIVPREKVGVWCRAVP